MPSGQTSALDLSLASPSLGHLFTWSVHDDPLGSDHFPVWIQYQADPVLGSRPQRWHFGKADWTEFQSTLETSILARIETPAMTTEDFTSLGLSSADGSIPRTSGQPRRTPVPWWTKECGDAIRARKRAFRKFDRRSTTENLIAFRKARAFARRTIKEAKANSWRTYVSSLNRFTPTTQVWTRIKRIAGQCNSVPHPVLRVNNRDITHPADVADVIGRALHERSRSGQTGPRPTRRRVERAPVTVDFSTSEHIAYNEPFTTAERESAINSLKSVSEGPDAIHNNMLLRLPAVALEALLAVFNSL